MSQRDPYSVLGVDRGASGEEIRQAFLRMTRLVHPDRFDPDKQPREWRDANDLLKSINESYSILRDPVRRAEFDRQGRQGAGGAESTSRQATTETPRPRPQTGASDAAALSHGHSAFSELPEKLRARLLERQAGKVREQDWAATERAGGYVFAVVFFSLWFPVLVVLAMGGRWDRSTAVWTLAASILAGLFIGWHLDWIIKRLRLPLRPRLYVTPLHLIETLFDEVRWWPLWTIRDLKVTHHYRNGSYQSTTLQLAFSDSTATFDLAPQPDVERLLATLRLYDEAARRAASEANWDYFAANDDFRGVAKTSVNALKPRNRRVGQLAGVLVALSVYGATAGWNSTLPAKKGPPPADRQLPTATQRDADLRPQHATAPRKPVPTPVFAEPLQPLPRNGALNRYNSRKAIAPFEIRTRGAEHHYFIKLIDASSEAPVLTVFVRGGQSVEVKVPLGSMKMRYAVGSEWYGERYLFGPETSYAEADSEFDFAIQGDQINGYTVELFLQPNGNLRERELRPDQW